MSRLNDGHSTRIGFANAPNIELWEKTVTPPGIDGGGENDTTTMHNEEWRTRQPKALKTLTNMSSTVAYDTAVYTSILAQINVIQKITVTFPDKSTYEFYGWLNAFTPSANQEGAQPTADIVVIPSNQTAAGSEVNPVRTAPPTA